jgi:hypothetical protein
MNKRIELDNFFNTTKEHLFHVESEEKKGRYMGVEDVKIFSDSDNILFLGTSLHKNGKLGMLYGDYDCSKNILESREIVCPFNESDCEKNWVFFNYNGELAIVYKWFPLQICKIVKQPHDSNDKIDLLKIIEMPKFFQMVRGSTSGFHYKNEIWFITHIVSYERPRNYYHSFVIFDESMNLLRYSMPFSFEGKQIEYCLGLIVEDERVIVPYSTWDRTTQIAIYDKKYIDEKIIYK